MLSAVTLVFYVVPYDAIIEYKIKLNNSFFFSFRVVEHDVKKIDRGLKFDLRDPPAQSYLPPALKTGFMDQALHGLLQTPVKSSLQDDLKTQNLK
jgi:hypothetical protein